MIESAGNSEPDVRFSLHQLFLHFANENLIQQQEDLRAASTNGRLSSDQQLALGIPLEVLAELLFSTAPPLGTAWLPARRVSGNLLSRRSEPVSDSSSTHLSSLNFSRKRTGWHLSRPCKASTALAAAFLPSTYLSPPHAHPDRQDPNDPGWNTRLEYSYRKKSAPWWFLHVGLWIKDDWKYDAYWRPGYRFIWQKDD